MVFKNLTGQIFGRLTVIKRVDDYISPKGQHKVRWLCECKCGNKKIVTSGDLTSGNTQSCGCLSIDALVERSKKYNQYILDGEYGIGITSDGNEFWFDLEDYDKIKDYCWSYNNQGYVVARDSSLNQPIKLHRLIMDVSDPNIKVDHRSHPPRHGHKKDNRKENLLLVTSSENQMNRSIAKNNTSGCPGVYWNKDRKKWIVSITYNKKTHHIGRYENFEDAVKAREEAERKYHQEYHYDDTVQN